MGIRERVWPGLRPRSIAFEAVIALVGTVAVGITTGSPDDRLTSVPVVLVGTVVLGITLFLFRRSAPLVPFLVGAALAVASPAVTIAVPLTAYAIGRYEGRWPVRIGAAVVGFVAVAQPWTLDELDQWIGAIGGAALVVGLAGALGAWARTRVELLAALTERAEKAESRRARSRWPPATPAACRSWPVRCRQPGGRPWTSCARWSASCAAARWTTPRRSARSPGSTTCRA